MDLDDETGYVYPELATSWTVSPDGGVYTFTLRGDATWSDGHPVTAEDVRYGILRTLDPATDSDYAYVLAFLIQNASEYNSGAITDPDLVGVKALDATHLEITMMQPAAYALPILSMWMARPLPKWAIEAHGSAWTEPANIVTSGAYRLKEWVHNDHILLEKNPAYFNAADVQIEEVKMWMVSEGAAWTMYLNGELDTVTVPYSVISTLDPIVRQEVRFDPTPCTYYYGFTTTNPPFDNPLVRKAFVAATDREGLIREVTRAYQHPAVTFTPPGIFGYVDGAAEGVGIPYDPARARQYLAQAGYPGGTGLPPVTLWHNTSTGHQAIAEYIRQGWQSVLGVNVIRQDMAWSDYRDAYREGQFQVWRLGWCPDYPDAINFLRDVFARGGAVNPVGGGVNWFNPTYESVVAQAAAEQDPAVRKTLYKQAEEILAETDAVIIPIYHYTRVMATRPYLDCPQGWYLGDIAGWRFTDVSAVIGAEGGSLTSYTGDTLVQVPAETVSEPVVMTITPAYGMPPAANFVGTGHTFDLEAVYESNGLPAQPAPGQSYTVTVDYEQSDVGVAAENTLALYGWDGAAWTQEGVVSSVDTSADRVTAQVDHFSLFTILGETKLVFLPLVMR